MKPSSSLILTLSSCALLSSCTQTECATPDYSRAECRVLAEGSYARLRSAEGVELRFQAVGASDDRETWAAEGLLGEREGVVFARVAHPGAFAISLRNTLALEQELELELRNVHPLAELEADALVQELEREGTRRLLRISLPASGVTWVRGALPELACARPLRFAFLADSQDNPTQLGAIVERIGIEAAQAEAAGELFGGAIIAGDLTERSVEDEFRIIADVLDRAAVPFVLTPGNHDVYASHQPYYNQNFGPGNYAFELCGVHLAMLDTGSGSIADSVLGRLPELFAAPEGSFSLVAMHHPPHAELSAGGWGREDLAHITLGEFARRGGDLVLAGHAHMLREYELEAAGRELAQLISGTAGASQGAGQPIFGYARLRFPAQTQQPSEPSHTDIERCFVEVPPPGGPAHAGTTTSSVSLCADN